MHNDQSPFVVAIRAALLVGVTLSAPAAAQDAQPPQLSARQTAAPPAVPAGEPASEPEEEAEAITVTGSREGVQTSIDATSYSLANDLQAANGTLADALRNVPSVDVDPQGSVSLRGDPGVSILVDGQPSGLLTGPSRGQTILQLPADRYARVEVMTNPSAAYSPEGSGGVINLITRPTAPRAGTTASGSVRAAIGDRGRWTAGLNGSWLRGAWTLSGDLSHRDDPVGLSLFRVRERLDPATGFVVTTTRNDQEIVSSQRGTVGRLTAEYRLDDRTQLTAEARGTAVATFGTSTEAFTVADAAGAPQNAFSRDGTAAFDVTNWGVTARVLRRFEGSGHEWTNELRYDGNDTDTLLLAANRFETPAASDLFERSDQRIELATLGFTSAYVRPMADGGRLRAGYELTDQRPEQRFEFRRGPAADMLAPVDALTSGFHGRQTVHALYSTYERPIGASLSAQGGLRLEQADVRVDDLAGGLSVGQSYFRAFPTLHLEYRLSPTQTLRGSYSRRIQRPQPGQLNPFVVFVDPLNRRSGNAGLLPQRTDAVELIWQRRQGQSFYQATAYLRDTDRSFTDVARDIGDGLLLTRPENLGARRDIGLDGAVNGPIVRALRYSAGVNLFHQKVRADCIPGGEDREAVLASGRFSLNWQPTSADFVQLSGFWVGDTLLAQGRREVGGMLNFGYDYGPDGYVEGRTNVGFNEERGQFHFELKDLVQPTTPEARRVCEQDINEVITSFIQDKQAIERGMFDPEVVPEELTQVRMGKIVRDRYPEMSETDQEAIRQHAIAALNITQQAAKIVTETATEDSSGELKASTSFVDGVRKFMNVRDLDIDLIDRINPFDAAYAILAKAMNEGTLRQVQAAISARKATLTEDEARAFAVRAVQWKRERGRAPEATSQDPWERQLAEGVAAFARFRQKAAAANG